MMGNFYNIVVTITTFMLLLNTLALSKPLQDSQQQNGGIAGDNSFSSAQFPKLSWCTGEFDFDCGEGELRNRCISKLWMCDHVYDCTTGADEVQCSHLHQCPVGYFMCRNGDCIIANKRCDGVKDCLSESDERACHQPPATIQNSNGELQQQQQQSVVNTKPLSPIGGAHHTTNVEQHQAEAMVDTEDGLSTLSVLFFLVLFVGLALLATLWTFRRYPNTISRVDQALKDFHPRSVIPNRLIQRNSPPSRTNIMSPGNEQFFDNPMNTVQQPLMLNVATAGTSTNTPPSSMAH